MPNDMNTEQILAALQDPEQSDKIDMDDPKVIAAINSLSGADEALPGAEQDADAPAPGTEAEGEAADSNTEGAKAPATGLRSTLARTRPRPTSSAAARACPASAGTWPTLMPARRVLLGCRPRWAPSTCWSTMRASRAT